MSSAPTAPAKLPVVLCWHMHQPQYRDLVTAEWQLPWTYLHGIKDYVDMAAHLEANPAARAVVNFSPVLLEQLNAYAIAVARYLSDGLPLKDPVLAGLTPEGVPDTAEPARALLRACLRANKSRLIERFDGFRELAAQAERALAGAAFDTELIADLAVWYHLAWLGETVRLSDPRLQPLLEKPRGFTAPERRLLLSVVSELLLSIVPRFRRLQDSGRVELSISPWAHPILPLLVDFAAAREREPGAPLPIDAAYPGGESRARWHLARAVQAFAQAFGEPPLGCWPSEGALSEAAIALLDGAGFRWIASGGNVLSASLEQGGLRGGLENFNRPWRLRGGGPICFFRDDGLSDRIGFSYSTWHGDAAVADFVGALEELESGYAAEPGHVVAIIMDGENAWEHYPNNGYYFLKALYAALAEHPRLKLTTFAELLRERLPAHSLPRLVAGSWVNGTLDTWIGSAAKNRAWDLLCAAKRRFDQTVVEGALSSEAQSRAGEQLGVCEGSDFTWWFAESNPAEAVATFDALYRRHLSNLYRLLGAEAPAELSEPIVRGSGEAELGGTMRRADAG